MYAIEPMVYNANVDVDIITLKLLRSPSWLDWPCSKICATHEKRYGSVVAVTITSFIHVHDFTEM